MDGWMECISFQWMDGGLDIISKWMSVWIDRLDTILKWMVGLDWIPFQSRTVRSCQAPRNQELSPPEPTLWLLWKIISGQIISQTKAKAKVLQKTDTIEIGEKHLVMKTRLVRYGNAIMRNMYWRSNMEICLQRDVEILCYDANNRKYICLPTMPVNYGWKARNPFWKYGLHLINRLISNQRNFVFD